MIIFKGLFPIGQQTFLNVNFVVEISPSDTPAAKKAIDIHKDLKSFVDITGRKARRSIIKVATPQGEILYATSIGVDALNKRFAIALTGKLVSKDFMDDLNE